MFLKLRVTAPGTWACASDCATAGQFWTHRAWHQTWHRGWSRQGDSDLGAPRQAPGCRHHCARCASCRGTLRWRQKAQIQQDHALVATLHHKTAPLAPFFSAVVTRDSGNVHHAFTCRRCRSPSSIRAFLLESSNRILLLVSKRTCSPFDSSPFSSRLSNPLRRPRRHRRRPSLHPRP